jgi:hypothetical protein
VRAHLKAIQARLTPIFTAHIVDVPAGATYPYYLIWSGNGDPAAEQAVDAARTDIDTTLGLTAVGTTWESASVLLSRAKDELCPGGRPGPLEVPGCVVTLDWLGSGRTISPDRDVTIGSTNRHPVSGVDLYRLVSVPA